MILKCKLNVESRLFFSSSFRSSLYDATMTDFAKSSWLNTLIAKAIGKLI